MNIEIEIEDFSPVWTPQPIRLKRVLKDKPTQWSLGVWDCQGNVFSRMDGTALADLIAVHVEIHSIRVTSLNVQRPALHA
jgi:hypothetical protein